MQRVFARSGYELRTARDGADALALLREVPIDVVISDIQMPSMSGADLINILNESPEILMPQIVFVTAFGTVEQAVELMQKGAVAYLTKPLNMNELRAQVARCMKVQNQIHANEKLAGENRALKAQIAANTGYEMLVGESAEMRTLIEKIRIVADTRATVLVEGESGTGKELVARAVHHNSSRAGAPFIPVHCAALAESLIESELFGHEKGAFTGATERKLGLFELANGGTLFLDEIGEVPLTTQVKLLRVLESREFLRVGGAKPVTVDVRIVAATNKTLREEADEGRFREDLYYRLSVVQLHTPALRTHTGDIPLLVERFLSEFAEEHRRGAITMTADALECLRSYHWPGNIRQLKNTIESLVLFAQNGTIQIEGLPAEIRNTTNTLGEELTVRVGEPLDLIERKAIQATLRACDGNRTRAAEMLGVNRRTIIRKIQELGLED